VATFKELLSALQTFTVDNLHSLASSVTAGWQSAVVDNTSDLYLDALVMVVLDFANTAPANDKAVYLYAYGGLESGVYTNPASGSEGAITLASIAANPQNLKPLGAIPYSTQDEIAEGGPFSVAAAFGGVLPPYWGVVLMNYSGAALHSSGNTVKWRGVHGQTV
jgi:hypothetical protein